MCLLNSATAVIKVYHADKLTLVMPKNYRVTYKFVWLCICGCMDEYFIILQRKC